MESIGRQLRAAREARAMSIEEISRATRIPMGSVERIENDHFDDLPGEVFVRGFLRAYARAVQLPVDDVLDAQMRAVADLAATVGMMPFHPWVDGDVVHGMLKLTTD